MHSPEKKCSSTKRGVSHGGKPEGALLSDSDGHLIDGTTAFFRALAHPIRLQILLLLSEMTRLSAGTLLKQVQRHSAMEQSAFSHQLRVLREHRLVSVERVGREMHYTLVDDHVQHIVRDAIEHLREEASSVER